MSNQCCHTDGPKKKWYTNKLFVVFSSLLVLVILSIFFPVLEAFRNTLYEYVRIIWWAILLGLLLGGVIEQFIPREHISYFLAGTGKRTIVRAVFLGFLMTACCHGILAIAIQLYKKGASTASVIAFLLASPWANLPLTIMLIGFFGVGNAIYIIVVAIIIAITTGTIFQWLESRDMVECNSQTLKMDEQFSILKDCQRRFKNYQLSRERIIKDLKGVINGSVTLANMILWWILIGIGIASLIGAYVPKDIFQLYMGPTVSGLLITLILATVMEVCSEGTAPVAFEIFRQTQAIGNSFVFLMGGVVTDYTEIGLIWHNIGKRTAIFVPLITVPQVLLWGFLANMFLIPK